MGCCKWMVYLAALVSAFAGYKFYFLLYSVPPIPDLPANQWWGPGAAKPVKADIVPFKIAFKPEMIKDLKDRLNNARFYTEPLETVGFQYGFNNKYLKKLVEFWKNDYKFEEREAYLNKYPHFKTNIQGLDIHYIHVKPAVKDKSVKIYPLLMLHGWPGSVIEFYKAIPLLTAPGQKFAFELIVPSLPGYGWSQGASKPGMGAAQVAVIMNNLMKRLGHEKYVIQGGDWGAVIGSHMSVLYPESVYGHHTNMPAVQTPISSLMLFAGAIMPSLVIDKEHESRVYPLSNLFSHLIEESGYFHLQATKPDTIGVALSDSPVGLAAYIIEKFSAWTNNEWKGLEDGGFTKKFTLTDLLDNIMIYWSTQSITTSVRLYSETMNKAQMALDLDRIPINNVPVGVTRCANELMFTLTCQLKEKFIELVDLKDHPNCGHFFAFEEPKLFADDVWSAVAKFEQFHAKKTVKSDL